MKKILFVLIMAAFGFAASAQTTSLKYGNIQATNALTVPSFGSLPNLSLRGSIVYLNTLDSTKGFYGYSGTGWVKLSGGGSAGGTGGGAVAGLDDVLIVGNTTARNLTTTGVIKSSQFLLNQTTISDNASELTINSNATTIDKKVVITVGDEGGIETNGYVQTSQIQSAYSSLGLSSAPGTNGGLYFAPAGSTQMILRNDGFLGINVTNAPGAISARLHVNGSVRLEGLGGTGPFLGIDGNGYVSRQAAPTTGGATGPQGPAGTNGKSAYQLWLDAGNSGTQAQYLASLKGDPGATGPAGSSANYNFDSTGNVKLRNVAGVVSAQLDFPGFIANPNAVPINNPGSFITQQRFDSATQRKLLGTLYTKSNWINSADFVNNGATPPSVVAGKILVTTAAPGALDQSYDLSAYGNTMLENYRYFSRFIVQSPKTADTHGPSIGTRSSNTIVPSSIICNVDLSSNAGAGHLSLINMYPSTTVLATSPETLDYSNGDKIEYTLERIGNKYIATARNVTTNSAVIKLTGTYYTNYSNPFPNPPNTGKFAVFISGGSYLIDSMNITSKEVVNQDVLCIGDSKTFGIFGNYENRWPSLLKENYGNLSVSAGGGDKTIDVLNRMPELLSLKPKQALLELGTNDVDTTAFKSNYASIVSQLQAANIKVFHLAFYQPNNAWRYNYLLRTFPANTVIDTWSPTQQPGALAVDDVHLSDYGDTLAYNAIVATNYLTGGSTKSAGAIGFINGGSSQFTNTTGGLYYPNRLTVGSSVAPQRTLSLHGATDAYMGFNTAGAEKWVVGNSGSFFGFYDSPFGQWRMGIDNTNGNVGINTTAPTAKLHIQGNLKVSDNIEITDASKGVILKSPNGNRFLLHVNDDGIVTTTQL